LSHVEIAAFRIWNTAFHVPIILRLTLSVNDSSSSVAARVHPRCGRPLLRVGRCITPKPGVPGPRSRPFQGGGWPIGSGSPNGTTRFAFTMRLQLGRACPGMRKNVACGKLPVKAPQPN